MEDQGEGQSENEDQGGSQSEEYKVVVNGEEQTVPLDELLSGYQRQSDYTNKTQELSSEKERYEKLVEEKATELYLKAMEDGDDSGQGGKNLSHEGGSVQAELDALKSRLALSEEGAENREADRELDGILGTMRDKYPDMDEEKVLIRFHNEAKEHDDPNSVFDSFAKESHEGYGEMRKKIIDDYIAKKSVNPFDSGENGGSATPASNASKPVNTFEEARARAEERLRGNR